VHTTKTGGEDFASGVVNVRDTTPALTLFGAGYYLEGNIILDAEQLVRNYDQAQTTVTFSNNILPFAWTGPGGGNVVADPLLKHVPQVSETFFTTWSQAQIMRDWLSLLPGSPAIGTGPNGRDQGGVNPIGASIAGAPIGTNNLTTAQLSVGFLRSGYGISTNDWPNGSGYTHYKWRLDSGSWSAETATTNPISLSGLANGSHFVSVTGKRDSGWYQDDPAFGGDALVTTSRVWVVNTSYVPPVRPTVRLNEILAVNTTTFTNSGTTPDLVELYNYGNASVDLSGMGLATATNTPYKYFFPAATPVLGPGKYLTLFADSQNAAPGIHLGFALKAGGDSLYLFNSTNNGSTLLDAVSFGLQVSDLSIGRGADGAWVLCQPTLGTNNLALPLADVHGVKINEWLADELFLANNDFIELFNPGNRPTALGGCYLSNAEGSPQLNRIPSLSFMSAGGYQSFVADGDVTQGANHLNFTLDPNVGEILLSDPSLVTIDAINYGPQVTDISQGRSPSGSSTLVSFTQPTAGGPNPAPNGGTVYVTNITSTVFKLLDITNSWRYNSSGADLGITWYPSAFNDSAWPSGIGLFGVESTPAEYPYAFNTAVPAPGTGGPITVYYRTHFTGNSSLTNVTLVSTNYLDDGAAYYLNGAKVGSIRMPASYAYNTLSSGQPANEGTPDILIFTNATLLSGDNVMAVEVHQINNTSSDDAFGMQLYAVRYATNIITTTTVGVPVVLNEILASNRTLTNSLGATPDWIEVFNTSSNVVNLADLSLSDNPNSARKYIFAPGTTIPANGFLKMYCDNTAPVGTNNTGFTLSASGGTLFLFNNLTNGGGLIDSVSFGLQVADFSIGRIPDGSGSWALNVPTLGTNNNVAALDTVSGLKINEWMAANTSGPDWFEVCNLSPHPVALGGLFLTRDLSLPTMSPIPPLSFIGAGGSGFIQFIADKNPGADHVNFKLSKSGLPLGLYAAGIQVDAITFTQQTNDISEGRFPDGSATRAYFTKPTPAAGNYLPIFGVNVNEMLTHTAPPLEHAVEFYNTTSGPLPIGGWFLSNSKYDLKKYRVADGSTVPAHGFKVFYENQFNPTNGSSTPFTFDAAHGDTVYLSQADGVGILSGYRIVASFDAAAANVSLGNFVNSIGEAELVPQSAPTFGVVDPATVGQFRTGAGATNAYPLVGPVVINEIMFNPPLDGVDDNLQDEYIELENISSVPVPLFDPAVPTNTWQFQNGVTFAFPQSVTMAVGQTLLVVNFDPLLDVLALAEFRSRYNVSNSVPIYGPYAGHLSNSGENLALYKPDAPLAPPSLDAGFVPYVRVDKVNYSAIAPWPVGATGTGSSLQRLIGGAFGNEPTNWFVAASTAGRANTANAFDMNTDGLPDAWQMQNFGSISDPQAVPTADPDGDGFNNLQEYLAGTNPRNAASLLKLDSAAVVGNGINLRFTAVAGRTYSVLWNGDLKNGTWSKLADVAAQSVTGPVTVTDPTNQFSAQRFYRLVTPQSP